MKGVDIGNKLFQQRRTLRREEPFGFRKVFHRMRKAVHPATRDSSIEFVIAERRLGQQFIMISQRHDGVEHIISSIDPIEIGRHHLTTRHRPVMNGTR